MSTVTATVVKTETLIETSISTIFESLPTPEPIPPPPVVKLDEDTPRTDDDFEPDEIISLPFPDRTGTNEAEEVEYLRTLISHIADENVVTIVPANKAFTRLAMNVHCRMLALDLTNVLFWALDKSTADLLKGMGLPVYFNPSFFSHEEAVHYHSELYNKIMKERPKF